METVLLLALGLLAQVRHGHLRGSLPPALPNGVLGCVAPSSPVLLALIAIRGP